MTTLRKSVSDALRRQGFTRYGQAHIRRVDDDFSLCVDTGPIGPRTDIAPVVGTRFVVIALLNGDAPAVVRDLARAESIVCTRADEVCEQFRAFEERVRARLSAIGAG